MLHWLFGAGVCLAGLESRAVLRWSQLRRLYVQNPLLLLTAGIFKCFHVVLLFLGVLVVTFCLQK